MARVKTGTTTKARRKKGFTNQSNRTNATKKERKARNR